MRRDVEWVAKHGAPNGELVVNSWRQGHNFMPFYKDAMNRSTDLSRVMASWKYRSHDAALEQAVAELK
jgi:hypothetical protein